MLPAETVLANRYKLVDKLGEGGAAVVYRAQDMRLGRTVAVKVLRPAYIADAEQAARFEQEARAAAALTAPNIVDVYDYGQDAGTTFIVMRYVDGEDLKHLIRQQGRLAPAEAARIALALAHGLGAAHAHGLIHRDVKPQNILIDHQGQVLLTDFGVAKALGGPGLTQAGMTYGTAAYLSPEQATGGTIGPPADIYALGIVLYEMLCGQPPFQADNVAAIAYKQVYELPPPLAACVPTVPPALAAVVARALEKAPAARYPTAGAMAADLEAALRSGAAPGPAAPPVGESAPVEPPHAPPASPLTYAPAGPPALPGYQPTASYAVPGAPPVAAAAWPGAVAVQPTRARSRGWLWLLPLLLLLLAGGFLGSRYVHINTGAPPPTPAHGGVPPAPPGAGTAAPASPIAGGTPSVTVAGGAAPSATTAPPAPPTAVPVATVAPAPTEPPAPTDSPAPPAPAPTEPPAPPAPTDSPAPPTSAPTDSPAPPAAPTASPAPAASPPASGTRGRPVFDTPTPPTGTNRRVLLEDVAFSGGYRYPPPSVYEGRTAVWVYGQGTAFASMTAPFLVTAQPTGQARLLVSGMDSEDRAKTPLRLLINGQVIYNGPDLLPNDYSPNAGTWGTATWAFPAALLHPGENTVTVENLAPSAALGIPFIMVDSAEITWDGEQ